MTVLRGTAITWVLVLQFILFRPKACRAPSLPGPGNQARFTVWFSREGENNKPELSDVSLPEGSLLW